MRIHRGNDKPTCVSRVRQAQGVGGVSATRASVSFSGIEALAKRLGTKSDGLESFVPLLSVGPPTARRIHIGESFPRESMLFHPGLILLRASGSSGWISDLLFRLRNRTGILQRRSHGGPIRSGLPVRIAFLLSGMTLFCVIQFCVRRSPQGSLI